MATIAVEDRLLALLKSDAIARGMKVEARAAQILEAALDHPTRRALFVEEANRIAALTPKGPKQTPTEVLLREDRDR